MQLGVQAQDQYNNGPLNMMFGTGKGIDRNLGYPCNKKDYVWDVAATSLQASGQHVTGGDSVWSASKMMREVLRLSSL